MRRIILFTIGSVQNFIIDSRKTIDLQNASNILSNLLVGAIMKLYNEYKGEVILPCLDIVQDIKEKDFVCPNYFIASYEHEVPVGNVLKELIAGEFSKKIDERLKSVVDQSLAEQIKNQLETALDIYWCDILFSQDLKQSVQILYEQMEAIKNTRNFASLSEPEGEKCHICGVRNAVICKKNKNGNFPYKIQKKYFLNNISEDSIYALMDKLKNVKKNDLVAKDHIVDVDNISSKNSLKEGECLCSVCFAKRIENDNSISSLSEIALRDWLEKVDPDNTIKQIIDDSCEDRYQAIYNKLETSSKEVKDLFQEHYQYKNIPHYPTYYCLFRMDIDNLGKRMRKEEYSEKLSTLVFSFLKSLKKAVSEPDNVRIVYAGGDDLLALMSIEKTFEFVEKLNEIFNEKVRNSAYSDLTYSQGLFFAHHKSPFSEVLRLSRDKLDELKNRYKHLNPAKNGTIVSILTEGFCDQSVYFKNYGSFQFEGFLKLMSYFKKHSTYFHNTLGEEFSNFGTIKELKIDIFLDMLFAVQRRLMERSLKQETNSSLMKKEEIFKQLEDTEMLLKGFLYENCFNSNKIDIENYFNLFAIIKKLNTQKEVSCNEGFISNS